MPHGVQRNAHERGVGDSEDVARLEIRHPNERNDLSPKGDKVFPLRVNQTGEHVDQIVSGERPRDIAANQVDCNQLRFVGQGDAYGSIIAKVEASTRSNGVYVISPHACRGVVKYI